MSKTNQLKSTKNPKSSRLGSDYFELLACQYICHLHNLTFSYSADLSEINSSLLNSSKGIEDMKTHTDNFNRAKNIIKDILENQIINKGQVIKSIWIGRNLHLETTSDVDAEHITQKLTRFSLKSVKSGYGTGKNLGHNTLWKFLKVDFQSKNEQMWLELKNYLQNKNPEITEKSQAEIKKFVKKSQKDKLWATENGKKLRQELNLEFFKKFHGLDNSAKIDFLNFVTDNQDQDLFVLIVNQKSVKIYEPAKEFIFQQSDKIEAKELTESGFKIFHNGNQILAFQTNCTNGLGISAFCVRVFFS